MSIAPKLNTEESIQKLIYYYIEEKQSTTQISSKSNEIFGFQISPSSIYNALVRNKICVRSKSDSVGPGRSFLDYNCSYENEQIIEWVDGFVLGDGYITINKKNNNIWKGARYTIGTVEREWCEYAMSGLSAYLPSLPKQYGKIREKLPRLTWSSVTSAHPDIVKQAQRWYPYGKKKVPTDVRITPTSILLWYLGDGSNARSGISNRIRFATCSFDPYDIDNILIPKLIALGLDVSRDQSVKNDIVMSSKSVSRFFEIIGNKSPISCYNYKFEFHQWLTLKRLSDIVPDKKERWRVQYMFKRGKLDCTLSPGGKMILFTPEQESKLLDMLKSHKFHEEYTRGIISPYKQNIQNIDEKVLKLSDIVRTPMERWNARYLMVTERVQSLKGSKFTIDQAELLREKLNQYGDKLAIPDKDIKRYFEEARSWGFPYYDISKEKFIKSIKTLKKAVIDKNDNVYNWIGKGSELASFFHPHMFECRSKGNMSALELFNSDEDFRRAIWKVIALYGKITKSNIREICRNEKMSSRINQFPPRVAMSVIKELYPNGGINYLDPTHGFSGRLIGAYCSGLVDKYVGIDLSIHTHNGALKTVEWMTDLSNMEVDLYHGDCLDIMLKLEDKFDLIFTSPPFLNIEQYKDVPFETNYTSWLESFVRPFCINCRDRLKDNGKMALYLEKIKGNDFMSDLTKIAIDCGFKSMNPVLFKMSYGENNRDKDAVRLTKILVFQK